MLTLCIATTNAGKLRDFALASDGHVSVNPLPGLAAITAPEEDQDTFEGNARLKAVYYSRFTPGKIVIADDSGLEVDALGGAPGVRSARYAEDFNYLAGSVFSTDVRNNQCLMAALNQISNDRRQASYRCVLAAAIDGEVVAVGVGAVEGLILNAPRGDGGFGYDPYFAPEGLAQSMAELEPEARLQLSHRGRALHDVLPRLRALSLNLTR